MGPLPARKGNEADHAKIQFSRRRTSLVACGTQVQVLPHISHQGDVQYGIQKCGGPCHTHPGAGPPPLGMP